MVPEEMHRTKRTHTTEDGRRNNRPFEPEQMLQLKHRAISTLSCSRKPCPGISAGPVVVNENTVTDVRLEHRSSNSGGNNFQ